MRKLFNKLALGLVVSAIAALNVVSIMAQEPDAEKTALYTKFTECYRTKVLEEIAPCVAIGKDYLQKYGTPPDEFNKFVSTQIPKLEARPAQIRLEKAYEKFNNGFKSKNWRMAFDGGKEVISLEPKESTKLDMTLLMASLGYDLAFGNPPDNAYNAEALNAAKSAIRMIESGIVSESRSGPNNTTLEPTWGGTGTYAYKSKDNALAWMNFTVGRLIADTNKDQSQTLARLKEAAPYFYKSVQYNSDIKKFHTAYQALGRYYLEELNNIVDQYNKVCKDLPEDTEDCKKMRGMQVAYAGLGLDAYARAYNIAKNDPKQTQKLRDSLNTVLGNFYNIRFKKTDGINDYLAKVSTQPLADPAAPVTPIILEEPPATATAPSSGTPGTNGKPATTPATTTKPATTPANTTKPPTTPAKPTGTKGKVAKTAVKKKSGR